jgi:hypothetical protein
MPEISRNRQNARYAEDTVSVLDFGAVGDGVTDDTLAIQAAIDYAQSNQKSCFIPGGEYIFTQIVLPRGTHLYGEGSMGTLETNDKYSQTILIQSNGNENSGIILRDESFQAADLYLHDFILLGPATATTGEYHGIEFINESGQDVAVQGQVFFERLFIRRWKGSGIKTSDTRAVFAFTCTNVQCRNNGRYGFEISYHPDRLSIRNILTEKNRLAGVYIGDYPTNFHGTIDGWYFEGGFDSQGFGVHPSFPYVSPYALEMKGCSTNTSNTVFRVSNVTCKADTGNSRTVDAAIYLNTDASLHPMNVQWDNIVTETRGITTGNGDTLYDVDNNVRVDKDMSSGHYFQDGTYLSVDYANRRHFYTSANEILALERTGSNGACLEILDDGVHAGFLGVAGGDLIIADNTSDSGIRLGSDRVNPCLSSGATVDEVVDLGQSGAAFRIVFAREVRLGGGTVDIVSGTGSPEGVVTSDIGSMYLREDGGAGTTLYVKESGTGNTGWVAK